MKFKVGDYVRIKKGLNDTYVYSKSGSTGHITEIIHGHMAMIKFDKLTGSQFPRGKSPIFDIEIDDIELVEKEEIKPFGIVAFCKENYK